MNTSNQAVPDVDEEKKLDTSQLENCQQNDPTSADVAFIPVSGLFMTDEEKSLDRRVNRKFDWLIIPILVVLFLFDGMDRSNIGNAATVNFLETAGLSSSAVNNASSFFFITFVPLQPVSAAFGKWIGVSRWLPLCMIFWGVCTLGNAFIHGDGALYAVRLLIGAFEAGFFPMCTFYISTLYPRFMLASRLAIFYGSFTFAGCFSGLVAYGVLQWDNKPLYPWQYLFILEGSLTLFFGVLALFWLPSEGCEAWWLIPEEKVWARERMLRDSADDHQAARGITKRDIIEVCTDWKMWLIVPGNMCASVITQAFNVFLPLIVQSLGYTSYRANLFTVPIYFVGSVGLIIMAYSSDHFKERMYHVLAALGFVIFGAILVTCLESPGGRYAALFIMNVGTYSQTPIINASLMNNTPGAGKRALVMGVQGLGNLGGVIAGQLFRSQFAPTYRIPFFASLGISIAGWLIYLSYRLGMMYINRKRARLVADWTPEQIEEENLSDVRRGDKKYTFVYTY